MDSVQALIINATSINRLAPGSIRFTGSRFIGTRLISCLICPILKKLVPKMIFQFGLDSRRRLTREEVAELYQRTGWLVFRRSCFLLRDEKEAQDVLQDVFVRVMRYGGPSGNRQVELGFLYRTAERCCFDRMRKRKQEPVGLPDNFEEFLSLSTEKRNEAVDMIVPFLNRLRPQLRQMALLYYLDDLSQEQIAEQLLLSRRTVGKRLKEIDQKAKLWAQRSREK